MVACGVCRELGKGCFWELHSPEWSRFMVNGDKAPTRPSYCHPWSNGVTPWLSHVAAGIQPLSPGYSRYAAMPHVSGRTPTVSARISTPHGVIAVAAVRDNAHGIVRVTVEALVSGVVGLRLADEESSCPLDLGTVTLDHQPLSREAIIQVPAMPASFTRCRPSFVEFSVQDWWLPYAPRVCLRIFSI